MSSAVDVEPCEEHGLERISPRTGLCYHQRCVYARSTAAGPDRRRGSRQIHGAEWLAMPRQKGKTADALRAMVRLMRLRGASR